MRGEKTIYRETYKAGARVKPDLQPTLHHTTWRPVETHLLAAGKVERKDGTVLEYQDLRVYLTEQ